MIRRYPSRRKQLAQNTPKEVADKYIAAVGMSQLWVNPAALVIQQVVVMADIIRFIDMRWRLASQRARCSAEARVEQPSHYAN